MVGKGRDDEGEGRLSGFEFIAARKRIRTDKKSALKVQLCHAMDQIIFDVKQAIELKAREGTEIGRPVTE